MPALRLPMDGDGAPFASQLSELTDTSAWRPAAEGFRMPQSLRSDSAVETTHITIKDQQGKPGALDQWWGGPPGPLGTPSSRSVPEDQASAAAGPPASGPAGPKGTPQGVRPSDDSDGRDLETQTELGVVLPQASRAETIDESTSILIKAQQPGGTAEIASETAGATSSIRVASQPLDQAVSTPKPAVSGQSAVKAPRRPAVSSEVPPSVPNAILPAPAPEIAATLPPTTDDAANNGEPDLAVKPPVWRSAPSEPAEPVAPTVTAAASAAQPAQELAFAARVQPVQSTAGGTLPAEMASAAAVASANKKVVAAVEDNTTLADPHGLLAASTPERTAESGAMPTPAAPASPRTEVPTPPAEAQTKPSAPLKDISLQVTQPGRERVDVRVVQQGGEVHVSVHSADTGLTSGLRQGLSDLQSRLEENGYRSEMWRPGASASPLAPAPAAQSSPNQSRGGDGQPQQGGSQQESGRRNQNQSNQPRWVEEMESSLGGREKSSGGFYGFSS